VLGDEHKNHQDYDCQQERPENIARSVTAHAGQLALSGRYEAMGHVRFTGVPADNAGNYQRDNRYSHGSPASLRRWVLVIHNVIGVILCFLRAGGAHFNGR
jgi:hypothetical protein